MARARRRLADFRDSDTMKVLRQISAGLLGCCALGAAWAQGQCGDPFRNHFGPYDYRSATKPTLDMVERIHFTPGIEIMTTPGTTTLANMAADVAYTLHVFPNHHRALITMMRLGERHKSDQPPGAKFTVECYFWRAVQYKPDDNVARLLYVQFLAKNGQKDRALGQLQEAQRQAGNNPMSAYNIGLVAYDLGAYELALAQAHAAAADGFPRKELEERLRKSGHWVEAPEVAASAASR